MEEELDGIGLSRGRICTKGTADKLEKELNELLSKTNELKGTKEQAIQTIEELNLNLRQQKNDY